jgi:hypothetical protein
MHWADLFGVSSYSSCSYGLKQIETEAVLYPLRSRDFLEKLMEAICSSETSVDFQQTTRRYIPEDSTIYNHRCENLKFYMIRLVAHYRRVLPQH